VIIQNDEDKEDGWAAIAWEDAGGAIIADAIPEGTAIFIAACVNAIQAAAKRAGLDPLTYARMVELGPPPPFEMSECEYTEGTPEEPELKSRFPKLTGDFPKEKP